MQHDGHSHDPTRDARDQERIRARAFEIYSARLSSGGDEGSSELDWLQAEQEVRAAPPPQRTTEEGRGTARRDRRHANP